jgi:PAS domain S-box-containing protein
MKAISEPNPVLAEDTHEPEEPAILDAVFRMVPDAIVSIDLEGRIQMFNPAAERIFGRSRASVQDQPVELLIPERMRPGHQDAQKRFANSGGETRMMGLRRVKGLRADGLEIDLEGYICHVSTPQGHYSLATLHDVTARVQAETQLQHSRAQLAELTRKLMMQERVLVKRMAQVLHDQLGQTLAAIRMCHETIAALQLTGTPSDYGRLQERMGTLIGQAISQVRQVLLDIRPPLLEEQGLSVALDNELRNRAQGAPQIDISIQVPPKLEAMRWPAEIEYAAFMVVREAVENALRHSRASAIAVDLSGSALSLRLTVTDNGIGIPEGAGMKVGHLGILGMQERAQAVGASVTCGPGAGCGTRVTFHWQGLS